MSEQVKTQEPGTEEKTAYFRSQDELNVLAKLAAYGENLGSRMADADAPLTLNAIKEAEEQGVDLAAEYTDQTREEEQEVSGENPIGPSGSAQKMETMPGGMSEEDVSNLEAAKTGAPKQDAKKVKGLKFFGKTIRGISAKTDKKKGK